MDTQVTLDTAIEDLVKEYPQAVGFLTKQGIRCIRCGEPLWCTLGELLEEDGVKNPQQLINKLNSFLMNKE
jgi:methionine synthase II (cobalamin-independent)